MSAHSSVSITPSSRQLTMRERLQLWQNQKAGKVVSDSAKNSNIGSICVEYVDKTILSSKHGSKTSVPLDADDGGSPAMTGQISKAHYSKSPVTNKSISRSDLDPFSKKYKGMDVASDVVTRQECLITPAELNKDILGNRPNSSRNSIGSANKLNRSRRKSASTMTTPFKSKNTLSSGSMAVVRSPSECNFSQVDQENRSELTFQLEEMRSALQVSQHAHAAALVLQAATEKKVESCWEEVQAQVFLNNIQQQKIDELEIKMSHDLMNRNEDGRERSRKHKTQLKQVMQEKAEFEDRANQMIEELTQQMNSIQSLAMQRIMELENALMEKSNELETAQSEVRTLRAMSMQAGQLASQATIQRLQQASVAHAALEEDDEDGGGDGYETE